MTEFTMEPVLDHDNAEDFLDAFRSALPALDVAGGRVLIDCARVKSCDYTGLSALLMARRLAGEAARG